MSPQDIAKLIDESPMNKGMDGKLWLETPGNLAMASDAGEVVLFEQVANEIYEFHWLLSVGRSAKEVVDFTLFAIDHVFRNSQCETMFGLVPDDRRDSRMMARFIGAQFWGIVDTENGPCHMFIMTREMRNGIS